MTTAYQHPPKHEIYQHERFPGKWLVSVGNNGIGDCIFSSQEEAELYRNHAIAWEKQMEKMQQQFREEEARKQLEEEKGKQSLSKVYAFCQANKMSAMATGRVIKTLSKQFRYLVKEPDTYVVMKRHQAIEKRVDEGRVVGEVDGEKFLTDGICYMKLNTTELKYAEYLLSLS